MNYQTWSWEMVFVFLLLTITIIGATWLSMQYDRKPRDYLCPIAEISPDITQYERERCRKLRAQK